MKWDEDRNYHSQEIEGCPCLRLSVLPPFQLLQRESCSRTGIESVRVQSPRTIDWWVPSRKRGMTSPSANVSDRPTHFLKFYPRQYDISKMFFGGDPFEHFGGGGGGGGGGRRGGGPVDNEGLYKSLGVPKDADENTIKKAYKKLALKHHPDKGGDVEVV